MSYDVIIVRQPISALFDIKGSREKLSAWTQSASLNYPKKANSKTFENNLHLYFIGPEHWILRADLVDEDHLIDILKPEHAPEDISIVKISDTLTFFSVVGPDASEIISIATSLDTHVSVFGETSVSFTDIFGQKGLITRCQEGFEFAVDRSFGDMIDDHLARITS